MHAGMLPSMNDVAALFPALKNPMQVVKEQTGALRREEDRRKAVESALARLRKERSVPSHKQKRAVQLGQGSLGSVRRGSSSTIASTG